MASLAWLDAARSSIMGTNVQRSGWFSVPLSSFLMYFAAVIRASCSDRC